MISSPVTFYVVPMEVNHAAEICEWVYKPPYNIYGWMSWEQMQALDIEFGDPRLRGEQYVSVVNSQGFLCGFAQLFPMEGVVRLGIGMRPDLCGQGMGHLFMSAIVKAALARYPEREIDLEVLTWNQRAIRAYQKSGFTITDTYERRTPTGDKLFYCMVYDK
ncbi:acetyltransferase [Paenibacillus helianthi]|uniref:Acetyltransferase n=1 Tax=Paenibacillus helianthi TaxID=1349432 RepID=A0ABX3EKG8_9BACL|nr:MULTISPECIES: GNAT family N-acetyltransferase [Paenibacillus]OKP75287.1 acetyltransferase [Paenibacillus sp. P3E]OKP83306.1 acetyltransferase [Paenibacillus helianthi]OKP86614.1 acetyltransferase [Paenibacillus sp. P32E]